MVDPTAISGDEIASCVLDAFRKLPAKRKPRPRLDDSREWVPLSGVVLAKDEEPPFCASLGTGMKCLPASKLPQAHGIVLHDCHAEIIATRAFNRFLIHECARLVQDDTASSSWIRRTTIEERKKISQQPFALEDNVVIYFYSSETPCGDASMELTMLAQEDATPWERVLETAEPGLAPADNALKGRGFFSELGIVRRKPARPDAPMTISKSCTDKMAMYQCTSVLNSTASLLISPKGAYITALVLPESQLILTATDRAFGRTGRMSAINSEFTRKWNAAFSFRPFRIVTTTLEFEWSRRGGKTGCTMLPSNVTAVYTPHFQETLIGGVLQGRKQHDPKGASAICRKRMWDAVRDVHAIMDLPMAMKASDAACYRHLKTLPGLESRRRVKEDVRNVALKGWVKNEGDDSFS
ncbi:hypothetical protein E2P81_ATG02612 [Venturia nashicola]|uniref:A to I editase domain-containing protein n=1 Tax=Venturia nashicola TaxID=86259 RepID=A0A4Z1PG61_9PEZI|nr:hypothetical protein E6O75_ATG02676 [Venturia nashicola]TLD36830.1 hypothetical protein E2P81_ATG02612 [Venturia nashicola]